MRSSESKLLTKNDSRTAERGVWWPRRVIRLCHPGLRPRPGNRSAELLRRYIKKVGRSAIPSGACPRQTRGSFPTIYPQTGQSIAVKRAAPGHVELGDSRHVPQRRLAADAPDLGGIGKTRQLAAAILDADPTRHAWRRETGLRRRSKERTKGAVGDRAEGRLCYS